MSRRRTSKSIYQRGKYWLDWDRRADGTLRSPFLTIYWYDPERRRIRSVSTGAADVEAGKKSLDARYVEETGGQAVCPTCRQIVQRHGGHLVTTAIADYQTAIGDNRSSSVAIAARLAHITDYIGTLPDVGVSCEQIDEQWIGRFRTWSGRQPIVSRRGNERQRSPSTTEGSVRQLAAAVNFALDPTGKNKHAGFRAAPPRDVDQSPRHRSPVDELAAMFRYASTPKLGRENLHRYLIAAIATWARPDAIHDISTTRARAQWIGNARALALNPKGRRQTKKYRATVPVVERFAKLLDQTDGYFLPIKKLGTAWRTMVRTLGLPADRESGTKLVRRSMATLGRRRLGEANWIQGRIMMGHVQPTSSDIYALFEPSNLGLAIQVTDAIMDEIETLAPDAFNLAVHRSSTGDAANVVPFGKVKRIANADR